MASINIYANNLNLSSTCKDGEEEIKCPIEVFPLESLKTSIETLRNEHSTFNSIIATLRADLQVEFSNTDLSLKFLESTLGDKFKILESKIDSSEEKIIEQFDGKISSLQSAFDDKVKNLELHIEEKLIKQFDDKIISLQLTPDDKVKNIEMDIEDKLMKQFDEKINSLQVAIDDKVKNSELHIEETFKLIIKADEEIHRVQLAFEDLVNEKLKTSELRIHNLELQIDGKVSLAGVDQKFKSLESNLASINDAKFNNITEQIMELRAESVSMTKIEDIINETKDIKNIFHEFSRDIISNQNEINQLKLMLQNETDKNIDLNKILTDRINNLIASRVRESL
jgi:chromosome segregation ATPase